MSQLSLPATTFDIPAIYIQALDDHLVSYRKGRELTQVFKSIEYMEMEGPHFILQARPRESALLVTEAISSCFKNSESK